MFSNEEWDLITLVGNCIYKHKVLHINYMTYDLCYVQDSINLHTSPYIMMLGHEDEDDTTWHLFWYAQVLWIFHVNIRVSERIETDCMEFLWVH